MNKHFKDYRWIKGKPVGVGPLVERLSGQENYKIVVDPYFKRYTVEKYMGEFFETLAYDSLLLDFRKITPQEQTAWEREITQESGKEIAMIRDINDRVIIKEEYHFEEGFCRQCLIYSPHGLHIATQKMFYTRFGEPFNGVHLYDLTGRLVMEKKYKTDAGGNFEQLLVECWGV